MPIKHVVVIKFFGHSFVSLDNWSQVFRIGVPLWLITSKVDANCQLADYFLLSQMLDEKCWFGQEPFSLR